MISTDTCKSLYEKYRDLRLLNKYEEYALWTVPSVFGSSFSRTDLKGNEILHRDFQSIGGILVNSLTAKLTKLLFPVGVSFFKVKDTKELKEFFKRISPKSSLYNKTLIEVENECSERVLYNAGYAQLYQLIRTLIITGNAVVKRHDNALTVFNPKNFSVLRDNNGVPIDTIIREQLSCANLPEEVRMHPRFANKKPEDTVELFTRIRRKPGDKHLVYQEIEDIPVGEQILYAKNACPYFAVAWSVVNGDSYGHGLVEDYAGDFAKLSMLSEALSLYEIDACKVVNLVKAGDGGDIDALAQAQTGDWVQGDPDAVGKTETGNFMMIKEILADIDAIFQRLSIAFMYSANVRDAERVTAEEIRQKVQEADQTLGGVYSQLSEALHKPLAYLLIAEASPEFKSAIVANKLDIQILTGTLALGDSNDVSRLLQAMQIIGVVIPAMSQVSKRFDTEKTIDTILMKNGVNREDYMKSQQQLEEEEQQQQQQMAQMAQQANALESSQAAGELQQGF